MVKVEPLCLENRFNTFDHSVFLIEGSSHSYQRALHCFGVFLTRRDDIRALRDMSTCVQGQNAGILAIDSCRTSQ
jgi:hypothetical protein